MKFKDFEGITYSKDLSSYKEEFTSSKGEATLNEKLKEIFPGFIIYYQMPCFGSNLKLDFFLPEIKMAFEFDGKQHKEFNVFFHKNQKNFQNAQRRDVEKENWCELNKIDLIRVDDKNIDQLEDLI